MEEPCVEMVVRLPAKIARFINYASSRLHVSREELLARLIGDALVCLSSDMIDPHGSEWTSFIDIDLDEALRHALANLATNYVASSREILEKI